MGMCGGEMAARESDCGHGGSDDGHQVLHGSSRYSRAQRSVFCPSTGKEGDLERRSITYRQWLPVVSLRDSSVVAVHGSVAVGVHQHVVQVERRW